MRRLNLTVATLAFVVLSTHTFAGSLMPMDDSWDRTLGFLLYVETHVTRSEARANSPNYAYVWNAESWADDFRSTNGASNLGLYVFPFLDDQDGRPDSLPPGGDTPQSRARTLQWWIQEADGVGHPDWILYQCDRVTPAYQSNPPGSYPNMPLDFTNPDVVDWKVQNFVDRTESSVTAFSADYFTPANLNHACGIYRDGVWVQLFSGETFDPAYDAAVFNWAREIRGRLAQQLYPKGLVVNCSPVPSYEDQTIAALEASVDGILDEYGFTNYDQDTRDIWWPIKIRRMIELQNAGLAYYNINYIERFPPTQEQVNWILGSFLMAREHSAYIVIMEQPTENYLYPTWPHLPEYDVSVGHPCAEMTMSQGVYVRDFSYGMSVVNPSYFDSYVFELPDGNFTDLYGTPVETYVWLPPATGQVLVSSEARCF